MARREDDPIIRCHGVTRRYSSPGGVVTALDSVDLEVRRGELVAVAGPSGSGKSTLLAMVGCVDRPSAGLVEVDGIDVGGASRRARRRLRRSSSTTLLPHPSDNLFDGLRAGEHLRWAADRAGRDVAVTDELGRFGLDTMADRRVRELSGGEQQRLAIAVALVLTPVLLLADEPTASLDAANAALVAQALRSACDTGATVLGASHDSGVVDACDRVVFLRAGRIDVGAARR